MNSMSVSFAKHQKTIFLLVVIVIVLGGLYLIATMSNNKDTFTNQKGASHKFSTTEPTNGDIGVDFGENAVFVFHKMDGCGHCVTFSPVWTKVAEACNSGQITRADGKPIVMAIVDTDHPLSANVKGYPTIRKYNSNSPTAGKEFEGRSGDAAQSEQNLIQFVSND